MLGVAVKVMVTLRGSRLLLVAAVNRLVAASAAFKPFVG